MKRKDFLKRLGIGAAVAAASPLIAKELAGHAEEISNEAFAGHLHDKQPYSYSSEVVSQDSHVYTGHVEEARLHDIEYATYVGDGIFLCPGPHLRVYDDVLIKGSDCDIIMAGKVVWVNNDGFKIMNTTGFEPIMIGEECTLLLVYREYRYKKAKTL